MLVFFIVAFTVKLMFTLKNLWELRVIITGIQCCLCFVERLERLIQGIQISLARGVKACFPKQHSHIVHQYTLR